MNPVEQVQQWLAAIGETTYDPAHRERLMWEELREVQAAADKWHAYSGPGIVEEYLINLARELCDLAYVAIGTAVLMKHDWLDVYTLAEIEPPSGWQTRSFNPDRVSIERNLYRVFCHPFESRPIRRAAAYYGFGDKLEACFAAVHEANMRKVECEACGGWGSQSSFGWGPLNGPDSLCPQCHGTGRHVRRDADGRILKPAGWQPADLGPILFPEGV